MAKYAWQTTSGKISLKSAGFGELRSRAQDRDLGTIQELIKFAIDDLEREGRELNQVSEDLLQSGRALRAFLARKAAWLDPAALRREADEKFEEVELLNSFLALYEKEDDRASIPASMASYDMRPPKKKSPVGRPKKYTNDDRPYWVDDPKLDEPIEKPPLPKFDDTEEIEEVPEYVREARELFK